MSKPADDWKRLLVEGVVILVSILLAFGIDAWWEGRQETQETAHQVDRVLAELETNAAILEAHVRSMELAVIASAEFLAICGPDPEVFNSEDIGELFNRTFAVSTLSVTRNAAHNFLSSGKLTRGKWASVRQDLAALLSLWQEEERDSQELRRDREPIMERSGKLIPSINTMLTHPVMSAYEISKFPFDSGVLLSDMEFEGHLAVHAIRLELNLRGHADLLESHRALVAKIADVRGHYSSGLN